MERPNDARISAGLNLGVPAIGQTASEQEVRQTMDAFPVAFNDLAPIIVSTNWRWTRGSVA
jgi:hypothetical protein